MASKLDRELLQSARAERDVAWAELASLRRELATLLGRRKPRAGVTQNDQWIAAVAEVLAERDSLHSQLREEIERLQAEASRRLKTWLEAEERDTQKVAAAEERVLIDQASRLSKLLPDSKEGEG